MYQFDFGRAELGPPRLPTLTSGFDGILCLKKIYLKNTRQQGDKLFVEFLVYQSNLPQHQAGQEVIWKQALTDRNVAENAVFSFAAAVFGIDAQAQLNPQVQQQVLQLRTYLNQYLQQAFQNPDNNYFTGKYVRCQTRDTVTRNNRQFVAHNFFPLQQAA